MKLRIALVVGTVGVVAGLAAFATITRIVGEALDDIYV